MSKYIDLNRIEFVVTDACTGRCKHCSSGDRVSSGDSVNEDAAVTAVKQLSERFDVKSVMTFGGEPLLFADTVCKIHSAARDNGIPQRQLITNGFFSKDKNEIDNVAKALCQSGVNDVLLSVDVFHQEYIPLEPVMLFAEALLRHNAPSFRLQPAWVVNEQHENQYNTETKRILKPFAEKGIKANEGNDIFPSGNAIKYLAEYFAPPGKIDLSAPCGSFPYTSRLDEIDSICITPDGSVDLCSITIGNIYTDNILSIVDNYDPYSNPMWSALLTGGVAELKKYVEKQGIAVDISDYRSACGACRKIMNAVGGRS